MQSETHATWPLPATELKPALELTLAVAHADMTVLLLHDDASGAMFPAIGHGLTEAQCALLGTHRPGVGPFGQAVAEHRRIIVADALSENELLAQAAQSVGFRGIEIVPLYGLDGQAVGALAVMFRRARDANRRLTPLVDHCGQLVASAVQHARRRVEAERARDNAEQVGRAKIQFLARMSHELRTPLQSIAGYTELLRVGAATPLSPAQTRLLDRVRDNEQILVHVIDDLITFARLEAGHISYHIGPVPAAEALRVTEAVVQPLASDRGVTLEIGECPPETLVAADADKLKQVLVNLAANAVKFTGRGGVVRLACRPEERSLCFDVIDNGPGIAAEQLRDIFEPYVQVGTPLLDRFGGTGLGLAISREFAAGMRGQLSVDSAVGRGSVFTLRLPRAVPQRSRATRAARETRVRPA
jgi:signal transduction histidine kinase